MANDLLGEFHYKVDTAAATDLTLTSSPDARPKRMKIHAIRWVSNTAAAGDQVVIKDGSAAATVIWETRATGANYVEESRVPLECTGLAVTTLTSGTVYIYWSPYSGSHR